MRLSHHPEVGSDAPSVVMTRSRQVHRKGIKAGKPQQLGELPVVEVAVVSSSLKTKIKAKAKARDAKLRTPKRTAAPKPEEEEDANIPEEPRKKSRKSKEDWQQLHQQETVARAEKKREAELERIAAGVTKALKKSRASLPTLDPEVQALVTRRAAARHAKDWASSDALRDRLNTLGYSVSDVKGEQIVKQLP